MPQPLHFVARYATLPASAATLLPQESWHERTVRRRLLDSADRRLLAHRLFLVCDSADTGCALALHDQSGRHCTTGISCGGCPLRTADIGDRRVTAAIADALAGRALVTVRECTAQLATAACRNADGKLLGEITLATQRLDDGFLVTLSAWPRRGYHKELAEDFARRLEPARNAGRLEALAHSPSILLDRALMPAPDQLPIRRAPRFSAATPTAGAVIALVDHYRHVMTDHERGVRMDIDREFLHDYRIALRRARTVLGALVRETCIDPGLHTDLAWLSAETGALRDLDVWMETLGPDGTEAEAALRTHIEHARACAHERVLHLLASARYARLKEHWATWLNALSAADVHAPLLGQAVDRALRRRHRRLCRRLENRSGRLGLAVLHAARKDAKKLRYLLDAFENLYAPQAAAELHREFKRVQARAGQICDRSAHARTLESWLGECRPGPLRDTLAAAYARIVQGPCIDLAAAHHAKLRHSLARASGPATARTLHRMVRARQP